MGWSTPGADLSSQPAGTRVTPPGKAAVAGLPDRGPGNLFGVRRLVTAFSLLITVKIVGEDIEAKNTKAVTSHRIPK